MMPDRPAVRDAADEATIRVCRGARLTPAAYRFYRDVLLAFVGPEGPADAVRLMRLAARHGVACDATLARLAAADLVRRDPTSGAVAVAYPFSGVPTSHRVALAADSGASGGGETGGVEARVDALQVYAMCALDALGVPLMLGRAGVITSRDALTGDPITVTLRYDRSAAGDTRPAPLAAWRAEWLPATAVVVARPEGHEAEHDAGTCVAAGTCCPVTNFFGRARQAEEWLALHPSGDAMALAQGEALRRAHALFAGVLDRERDGQGKGHHATRD